MNREMIPLELLDENGYPTEEVLSFLRGYYPSPSFNILSFVIFIRDCIWNNDCGRFELSKRKRSGIYALTAMTGGWSGNEDIIRAIQDNRNIAFNAMFRHIAWKFGGYYKYEIRTNLK